MQRLTADWKKLTKKHPHLKVLTDIRAETMLPRTARKGTAAAETLGRDMQFTTLPAAPFADAKGNLFDVEQVGNPSGAAEIDALADRLAQRLAAAVILPDGSHRELGLVVDLSDHQDDRSELKKQLLSAIADALKQRGAPESAIGRVAFHPKHG
jgi:hypothetical protein